MQNPKKIIRYVWQNTTPFGNGGVEVGGIAAQSVTTFGKLFGENPDLPTLFNKLFVFAITIGAILAVVRLVYGGFIYMTKDVWSSKQSAVTIIQQAVIGLLLLLAVYIILYQINPEILKLQFLAPSR